MDRAIGVKLKRFRKRAKLSQFELAKLADVTAETISRIERGSEGSTRTVESLARALNVRPEDLAQ